MSWWNRAIPGNLSSNSENLESRNHSISFTLVAALFFVTFPTMLNDSVPGISVVMSIDMHVRKIAILRGAKCFIP